jgi:ABC-type uncharacterized transport system YnjBCD ATPase subunit
VTALFSFSGVTLVADGHRRLDGVDATVPDGAVTLIVGPSGSGKSSLLRLCNRLEAPTDGTVHFRGEDLAGLDIRPHRRRVGMLFQYPVPFAGTVRQNLAVADPDLDDDAAGTLLDRVALGPEFLDRPADRLSGGEAQRMCLARTLATAPEVPRRRSTRRRPAASNRWPSTSVTTGSRCSGSPRSPSRSAASPTTSCGSSGAGWWARHERHEACGAGANMNDTKPAELEPA